MSRRLAAGWLAAAWAFLHAGALSSGNVPFYRDQLVTNMPLRDYLRTRLLAGELPHWFPYEGLGMPFIGQLVSQTFHPLSWLLLPLPTPAAALALALGASALGLWAAYRFARSAGASREASVAAAIAFACGGYAMGVSSNAVYHLAHHTLPAVGWAACAHASRPRPWTVAALGTTWALMFLAGDVQGTAGAALLAVAAALVGAGDWRGAREALPGLAVGGVLAALLSGAELVPGLAVVRESSRSLGVEQGSAGWALSPLRLPELVLSGFIPSTVRARLVQEFLGDARTAVWSTTITFGAVALAAALIGARSAPRRWWPLVAVALLCLFLAMDDSTGAGTGFGLFRYPEKWLSLVWAASVPVVAAGMDAVAPAPRRYLPLLAVGAAAGAVVASLLGVEPVVAAVLGLRSARLAADAGVVAAVASAWQGGALLAVMALTAASLALWKAGRLVRPAWTALILAELVLANRAHLPLIPPEVLEESTGAATAVRAVEAWPRVISAMDVDVPLGIGLDTGPRWASATRRSLRSSTSALERVGSLRPNLALAPARLRTVRDVIARHPPITPRFHVCFATLPSSLKPSGTVAVDGDIAVVGWRCRRFALFVEARPAAGEMDPLHRLDLPYTVSTWEGGPAMPLATGEVTVNRPSAERIEVSTRSDSAAALLINEQYSPGWSATVDDAPAAIFPADVAVMGVAVPPGQHRVVLTYRTPGLAAGLTSSAVGLAVVAVLAVRSRRSRTARSRPLPTAC